MAEEMADDVGIESGLSTSQTPGKAEGSIAAIRGSEAGSVSQSGPQSDEEMELVQPQLGSDSPKILAAFADRVQVLCWIHQATQTTTALTLSTVLNGFSLLVKRLILCSRSKIWSVCGWYNHRNFLPHYLCQCRMRSTRSFSH